MADDDARPDDGGSRPPAAGARGSSRPLARARRVAGRTTRTTPPAGDAGEPRPGVTWRDAAPAGGPILADVEPADAADPTRATGAPTGESAATSSRAGRNLPAAIGVGLGLGAVIVASLFVYRASFAVIVGIAVGYGCWELSRVVRHADVHVSLAPIVVGAAAMLVSAWQRGPNGLVVALLVTVCAVFVWRLAEGAHGYLRDVTASTLILVYLPTLAGFAVLSVHAHDGAARIFVFIATVVCSDTGGYATGVLFGKHPLAPIVSKGKTWEGFAGSVLFCSVAGALFLSLTFHQQWWQGVLFGLAIAVTATVGDLGESMIKRDLEIKDMGNLLPGHGGIMDRLDSLLPCAAVAYLLLSAFAPV